jgi:hypothetical protein
VVPCFRAVRSSFSVSGISRAILFPAVTSYLPCFGLLAIIALPKPPCFGRYQVLTAASMKFRVFWDVAPCSHVEVDRRFRGAYCLQRQGVITWPYIPKASKLHPPCFVCLLKRTYRWYFRCNFEANALADRYQC